MEFRVITNNKVKKKFDKKSKWVKWTKNEIKEKKSNSRLFIMFLSIPVFCSFQYFIIEIKNPTNFEIYIYLYKYMSVL